MRFHRLLWKYLRLDWITVVGIAVSGSLALMGVGIGAFLTPYFEARWAKKQRTEELQLNTLVELQDTFIEWFDVARRYRELQKTANELGRPREFYSTDVFKEALLARSRLENRVLALTSRLIDKDVEEAVVMAVYEGAEIIATDMNNQERFDSWISQAGTAVPLKIGNKVQEILAPDGTKT